ALDVQGLEAQSAVLAPPHPGAQTTHPGARARGSESLPTALVANLPYNVSVPVILHFLERFESIERILVMVQAEVGHRLAARPGSKVYGTPSAKAAWYADVELAGQVSRQVFWPIPNVDSVLVRLDRREPP